MSCDNCQCSEEEKAKCAQEGNCTGHAEHSEASKEVPEDEGCGGNCACKSR